MLIYPFHQLGTFLASALFYGAVALVYVAIGVTESIMARLKMNLVPKYLLTSFTLAFFAVILSMGISQ
jgi:formate hydrogenlyase subunit 4